MLTFALAVFFLIITPGPGVLSLAGVGAAFGRQAGLSYLLGLFIGTNLVAGVVVTGLAGLFLAEPQVRIVLFALSFGYLCYLALRVAFAGNRIAFIKRAQAPGIGGGIFLQIVNPKAYAVNTALFTGFAFLPDAYTAEIAIKFVIMNLIWLPIHGLWLWAGLSLHRLDLSDRTHRIINATMALLMMTVVVLAVLAQVLHS